jgi:hypothetical protein
MTTETLALERASIDAARRGADWLLNRQGADGGWKDLESAPVDAYYKAAWAFNITGHPAAAERTITHVKENLLKADGDLQPRGDPWYISVHYQYANAWVVAGAQKQGRYDVSLPALRFLLTQQDPSSGGFYSLRASGGEKQRTDTMSSGLSGIACLAAGQVDPARRLAGYFKKVADLQPEPDARFYLTLESDGSLGTNFPSEEEFWRVVDTRKPDQCWYAVGLPFTFATLMHEATGDKGYADLAKWYFDFQSRCANPWDGGSSGKAGWGCSILYRTTGEGRYRDIALRVAKNQMNSQLADGSFQWRPPTSQREGYGSASAVPDASQSDQAIQKRKLTNDDFDVTSEFVVWLSLIGSNLLARDMG